MTNNSTEQSSNTDKPSAGSRLVGDKTTSLIFFIVCMTNITINLDHGIIPACTKEIMSDMNIGEVDLGLLGSLVYGGLIAGSILGTVVFTKFTAKSIILIAGVGNVLSLAIFPLSKSMFLLSISRILTGFFQVFFCIYFPVWVDLHGKEKRTRWLTILQVGVPLGVFLGYGITALLVKYIHWIYAYFIQIVILGSCVFGFAFFGSDRLSTVDLKSTALMTLDMDSEDQYLPAITTSSFLGPDSSQSSDYSLLDDNPQVNEGEAGSPSKKPRGGLRKHFKALMKNEIYRFSLLALTSLYFIVTGIQFWISDYMRSVLKMEKEIVFISYAFLTLSAPVTGVIVGGIITDKRGGYTSKEAHDFVIFFGVLSALSGLPIPFLDNFYLVCGFLWLELFFGGGIMPAITGIMISSVPKNMRAMGNSVAQLFSNALGYFPSPFVYGFVIDRTGGSESRWGMILLAAWAFWGVLGGVLARKAKKKFILTLGDINTLGLVQ